jgi:hypothetical protein
MALILTKEQAQELVWGDSEDFEVIQTKIVDKSRWSIIKRCVFRRKGETQLYGVVYSVGATESQDEQLFEYDGDQIKCSRVKEIVVKDFEFEKD